MPDPNIKSYRKQKTTLQKQINREEIRSKITPFTFREARRFSVCIYDTLLSEFYEDGCTIAARHFESLIQLERAFLMGNNAFSAVSEDRHFLLDLCKMATLAEKAGRLKMNGGRTACAKILYQSVILVEKYETKFYWLLGCYYDIIASILLKIKTNEIAVREIVVRFTYKYGVYLANKEKLGYSTMKYTTEILSAAAYNCKNESWQPDTIPEIYMFENLHQVISLKLAQIYLAFAKHLQLFDADQALEIAQKAIASLAEAGLNKNKKLVCDFYISKVDIMMELHKFQLALREIVNIEHLIKKNYDLENNKIECEAYKRKAMCYFNLNESETAMHYFQQAFIICHKYHFTHLEAQLMLDIGRAQPNTNVGQMKSRLAYNVALHNFKQLGDLKNVNTIEYLLAKMKANQIFPYIMVLLKSKKPCDFYYLRRWKNELRAFWNDAEFNDNEIDIMISTDQIYEIIFKTEQQLLEEQSSDVSELKSSWEEEKILSETEVEGAENEMQSSSTGMDFISKASVLLSIHTGLNKRQNSGIYCVLNEHDEGRNALLEKGDSVQKFD